MAKKNVYFWAVGAVLAAAVLVLGFNAQAYKISEESKDAITTDKSDRTILKEILLNEQEILALLKEVKTMLQAGR